MIDNNEHKGTEQVEVVTDNQATRSTEDYQYEYDTSGAGGTEGGNAPGFKELSTDEMRNAASGMAHRAEEIVESYGGIVAWLGIASAVLLFQAIVTCSENKCSGKLGFAVAGGIIPLIICLVFLGLVRYGKAPAWARLGLAIFSFVWWTINVGVLTFETGNTGSPNSYPYNVPSNAYIALWGGFAASVVLVSEEVAIFNQVVSRVRTISNYHLLVLCASVIVLFAAISPCSSRVDGCGGVEAYAVSLGVVGIFLIYLLIKVSPMLTSGVRNNVLLFQVIWWFVGTMICTFIDPFKVVSNGFFGCWAGVIGSMLLYMSSKKYEEGEEERAQHHAPPPVDSMEI